MLEVSKELELATHMNAQELCRELAVHLYALGKLSGGKARQLTDMSVYTFQALLGSRGIAVNYDTDEFADDVDTIQRLALDQ